MEKEREKLELDVKAILYEKMGKEKAEEFLRRIKEKRYDKTVPVDASVNVD